MHKEKLNLLINYSMHLLEVAKDVQQYETMETALSYVARAQDVLNTLYENNAQNTKLQNEYIEDYIEIIGG